MAALPDSVRIVEVGPRDGLQNEATPVPTADKIAFIRALAAAGLKWIEVTSFVHPARVPQLADAGDVLAGVLAPNSTHPGTVFSALVPNAKGLERALAAGVPRIAVFTAASETFTRKNIGMSITQSLETFAPLVATARQRGLTVRGYVSTCFVCPYEGEIDPDRTAEVCEALVAMGCDEVAVSDTIGAAAPRDVQRVVDRVLARIALERVALHLHDTYGTALANVYAGLELGVTTFDASAGGLGGCPFAPGAAGNLATEDLVYFLDRMGIRSGVNLESVAAASGEMSRLLGRPLPSRQLQRLSRALPRACD